MIETLTSLPTQQRAEVEDFVEFLVAKGKKRAAPKVQQQTECIQQLPRAKQSFVIEMLDTVLQQTAR
jgi:hypothetical protein